MLYAVCLVVELQSFWEVLQFPISVLPFLSVVILPCTHSQRAVDCLCLSDHRETHRVLYLSLLLRLVSIRETQTTVWNYLSSCDFASARSSILTAVSQVLPAFAPSLVFLHAALDTVGGYGVPSRHFTPFAILCN